MGEGGRTGVRRTGVRCQVSGRTGGRGQVLGRAKNGAGFRVKTGMTGGAKGGKLDSGARRE